jgi:colicin import membrane protein
MKGAWRKAPGCDGTQTKARVTLSETGQVLSVVVNNSGDNQDCEASVEAAIRQGAPYDMPDDPEANKLARNLQPTFK